jgi:hypothetical protein
MANQVFQVQHVALIEGGYHQAITDLIFRDGMPIAVLSWAGVPDSEYPLVTVPLDPVRLSKLSDTSPHYVYDGPIEPPAPEK